MISLLNSSTTVVVKLQFYRKNIFYTSRAETSNVRRKGIWVPEIQIVLMWPHVKLLFNLTSECYRCYNSTVKDNTVKVVNSDFHK